MGGVTNWTEANWKADKIALEMGFTLGQGASLAAGMMALKQKSGLATDYLKNPTALFNTTKNAPNATNATNATNASDKNATTHMHNALKSWIAKSKEAQAASESES